MDKATELKAELFDLQIKTAQIRQQMEIKMKELNELNGQNTKPVLPGNVKEEAPNTDPVRR